MICNRDARLGFINVSTVTVSGLTFTGCFNNYVAAVIQLFQLENSTFFGSYDQEFEAVVNATVLSIEKSTANLDRVEFLSIAAILAEAPQDVILGRENSTAPSSTVERMSIISLRQSNLSVTQSRFEGNSVSFNSRIIDDQYGSNITITNTIFIKNIVAAAVDNILTAVPVFAMSYNGSTVKIHDCEFIQNIGAVLIFGDSSNVLISQARFTENTAAPLSSTIFVNRTVLVIDQSTFTNNIGNILAAQETCTFISHSEFLSNNGNLSAVLAFLNGMIIIDTSKFVNNTPGLFILGVKNITTLSVSRSEFVDNAVT